jgi:apolipoprotein D and lipocalin family protein
MEMQLRTLRQDLTSAGSIGSIEHDVARRSRLLADTGTLSLGIRKANARVLLCALLPALLMGCATPRVPPLEAIDRKVDLERFMGDWYVIGFIPISLPFFSEAGAHNGVESYRLTDAGIIETTYTFRDGAFDGPEKRFTPKGWVHDRETNAEWRMQFLWPFRAAYLIVYLDPDYQRTIIGVPDRGNVWIMSRDPELSEAEYQQLLGTAAGLGYDVAKVKRVPQSWPAD